MANGYSTNTMQPARNQMAGIPQRSLSMILVDETTPNLEEIQSFPVIYRNGNVHIHQDPSTSQMYQMTDEFHSRIPQILAGSTSAMTGGVMPPPMTGGVMPPPMTGGVMMPANVSTEYSLQDQFEKPIIFTNSNSLVSQLGNYIITLSRKEKESIKIQREISIENEYISLYPELKEFGLNTNFNSQSTQYSVQSIVNKIKYAYPNPTSTRADSSNIQTSISYTNRYTYPIIK